MEVFEIGFSSASRPPLYLRYPLRSWLDFEKNNPIYQQPTGQQVLEPSSFCGKETLGRQYNNHSRMIPVDTYSRVKQT
jgi:hypothetical protein